MRRVVIERRRAIVLAALLLASCEALCETGSAFGAGGAASGEASGLPAGADCEASRDCPHGQGCVGGSCRDARTTVEGELLAAAGRGLLEDGDAAAANESYVAALRAYEQADLSAPPSVLCGSAEAALACSREDVPREIAARRADACFRGTLPGDAARERVLAGLAQMRRDGLDLAAFDEPTPPSEFFTAPRRRPNPGAVRVHIELAGASGPGSEEIDERLQSAAVVQAVVACYIEDWELHHQRSVEGSLPLRVASHLRDMGTYDVYEARVSFDASGLDDRAFGRCVASSLETIFAESFRMTRTVSWNASVVVRASAR